jgi:hypothetical protein
MRNERKARSGVDACKIKANRVWWPPQSGLAWLLIVVPMRSADNHLGLSFKNFPGT